MTMSVTALLCLWSLAALSEAGDGHIAPSNTKLKDCTANWMDASANLQCSSNEGDGLCEIDAMLIDVCTNKTSSTVNIKMNRVPLVDIISDNETKIYQCRFLIATSEIPTTMTTHKPSQVPTVVTTQAVNGHQPEQCVTSIILGAVVGLLVVLLVVVTGGWMWTCWTIKRRARITTNSRDIR